MAYLQLQFDQAWEAVKNGLKLPVAVERLEIPLEAAVLLFEQVRRLLAQVVSGPLEATYCLRHALVIRQDNLETSQGLGEILAKKVETSPVPPLLETPRQESRRLHFNITNLPI